MRPRSTSDYEDVLRARGTLPRYRRTMDSTVSDRMVADNAKPSSGVVPGQDAGIPIQKHPTPVSTGPNDESFLDGTKPTLVFNPDRSPSVKSCARIVHVQAVRIKVDDVVIRPTGYFKWGWIFKDKYVVQNGWYLDVKQDQETPDYQQDNKIFGEPGKKLSKSKGGSARAKMSDDVATDGPSRGFYDAKTNPGGCKKVVFEYETFAWCMDGDDCGKWYEGVRWTFTKTWEDHRDGRKGNSAIEDKNVAKPSTEFLAAFEKFNMITGFRPCTGKESSTKRGEGER